MADGRRREMNASFRSLLQPHTMSAPRSSTSTIAGMSRGSFCRSPSEVTITRPRAWSKPAANAAVWPKLRRNRITRSRGSTACKCARISKLSSVLPSSTMMSSYDRPQPASVCVTSRWRSFSAGASFRIGMTTLMSGTAVMIRDLSAVSALRFVPEHVGGQAGEQQTHGPEGRGRLMRLNEGDRPLAVPDSEQTFHEIAHAAPDGDRDREGPDADAGDAGQQDEDLERRRRRQDRRDEHRHDPVPAKRGQRAFDAGVAEPLAHQRVAAF